MVSPSFSSFAQLHPTLSSAPFSTFWSESCSGNASLHLLKKPSAPLWIKSSGRQHSLGGASQRAPWFLLLCQLAVGRTGMLQQPYVTHCPCGTQQ